VSGNPLFRDEAHLREAHNRWVLRIGKNLEGEWTPEQCGLCRFWIPLAGPAGADWGVCSNPASSDDGVVRFEHDGCVEFDEATDWVVSDEA
jgi:Protein of unknown function (DUF3027)